MRSLSSLARLISLAARPQDEPAGRRRRHLVLPIV